MPVYLDPRLEVIAREVRPGSRVADVGADHGYLLRYLIKSGKCPGGIACDIAQSSLDKARRTAAGAGIADKLEVRRSDGLSAVFPQEAGDIVAAGMGGELIARIVLECAWLRDPGKRLILQPMSRPERLREELCRAGFRLEQEQAVEAGRFVYTVITASYCGKPSSPDRLFLWTGLLLGRRDSASVRYLNRLEALMRRRAAGLSGSPREGESAAEWIRLADQIKEGSKKP